MAGPNLVAFEGTVASSAIPVSAAHPLPVTLEASGGPSTVIITGSPGSDASTTITLGGTAQAIFTGTPTNGFSISNPDPTNDLWVSDSTTALANGTGSVRVSANGGYYATEPGYKPFHAVSIVGAVTGQKITARQW